MRPSRTWIRTLTLVMLVTLGAGTSTLRSDFEAGRWQDGAAALVAALGGAESDGRALVVYFYTDWCGYCRQFERELLGLPAVEAYLDGFTAVRINPEFGEQEKAIADYYGVDGYPGFFVRGGRSRSMIRVERMIRDEGELRIMRVEEFIDAVRSAAQR